MSDSIGIYIKTAPNRARCHTSGDTLIHPARA
jgi:hypothetical protein